MYRYLRPVSATLFSRFFVLSLAFACRFTFGQQNPADSTKTNKSPYDYQPNASKLIPAITPKSPTAAALGRYGEYPVSLYTGLPNIEIPLYEFNVGNLTIPIKLTYHAAGNKVNDLASWVGLGWSLHTGGTINRHVQGLPDETQTTGILSRPVVAPTINIACQTETDKETLRALVDNEVDAQRDLFMYRMPSGSNTFMLMPDEPRFLLLSPEPIRIAYPANLTSFTLTDTGGHTFRFADREVAGTPAQTSTWHLSEIIGVNPADRAVYTYTSVGTTAGPEPYDVITLQAEVSDENTPGIITPGLAQQVNGAGESTVDSRQPVEILFPGGKVEFVLEAGTREGGRGLDYIDVFGYDVNSASYQRIKRFDFVYAQAYRQLANGNNGNAVALLSQLRLLGSDGITSIGSYSFSYNTTRLPQAGSRAKDFWGYYNGQTGQTLIPQQNFVYQAGNTPGQTTSITIGDANRDPNETLMQAWMLQSIYYPTGGSTTFTYETNRYSGPNNTTLLAGGLRVQRLQSYDEAGHLAMSKRYRYGVNESGLGTPRFNGNNGAVKPQTVVQDVRLRFLQSAGTASPKSYAYRVFTFSSAPSAPITPNEGSPVTYAEVTEYREDDAANNLGHTVFTFRDAAVDNVQQVQANPAKSFVFSRSWDRGQLISRLIYDNQSRLRSRIENQYTIIPNGTTSYAVGFLLTRQQQELNQVANSANPPCLSPPDIYIGPLSYNFEFGTTRLTQTSEYLYDDIDGSRYTLKTQQTDYSPRHYQPIENRTIVQSADQVGTRYSYPQDFTASIGLSADIELLGVKTLQAQNVHESVETISFRQKAGSTDRVYTTGQHTTYRPYTIRGQSIALPYQLYRSETDFNNKSYQTGSATGPYRSSAQMYNQNALSLPDQFPLDFVWQAPRATMLSYDIQGNLTSYSVTAGITNAYGYTTTDQGNGVSFSYLTSETKHHGVPLPAYAQTSVFSYTIPILGISSLTDPRGITTMYEYDTVGRLARIKDKDGHILKQFTYRFATSTEPQP